MKHSFLALAVLVPLFAQAQTATAPAPAPSPAPTNALYFSDCQTGAAAGCVPGNNANPGTQSSPKQNLSGVNVNALPAGSHLLFKRGGAWANVNLFLDNRNVTEAAPQVFSDWGTGPVPLLSTAANNTFTFGRFGETVIDGGYTFRNLKLDGMGSALWGLFVQAATRGVVIDNVEITRFHIALHMQHAASAVNAGVTVRNSNFHRNREHGILGEAQGLVIEGNRIAENNVDGGSWEHGIYLGGNGRNGVIRNNVIANNSTQGGVCNGGNLTVHGRWDGLLVEGNTVTQQASTGGCYGISINPSYSTPEGFYNLVIRNNRVVNVGGCAICLASAPGVIVEGNTLIKDTREYMVGVLIPVVNIASDDAADTGAIVRNNVFCYVNPDPSSTNTRLYAGAVETGSVRRIGADATTGVCAR